MTTSLTPTELNIDKLNEESKTIANQIIDEQTYEKVKDLTDLFNVNQAKKNLTRIVRLNTLFDIVSDQMLERFSKNPNNFSNADLLNYLQVTQTAIEKSNKILNQIDNIPPISIQQNNVNITLEDELSRDQRTNIAEAVKAILSRINTPLEPKDDNTEENIVTDNFIDITEESPEEE